MRIVVSGDFLPHLQIVVNSNVTRRLSLPSGCCTSYSVRAAVTYFNAPWFIRMFKNLNSCHRNHIRSDCHFGCVFTVYFPTIPSGTDTDLRMNTLLNQRYLHGTQSQLISPLFEEVFRLSSNCIITRYLKVDRRAVVFSQVKSLDIKMADVSDDEQEGSTRTRAQQVSGNSRPQRTAARRAI